MSAPEVPAETEARQILDTLALQGARIDRLVESHNLVGEQVQWIVDNCKMIFEMFHSPMFRSMMPGAMSAAAAGMGIPDEVAEGEIVNG